MSDSSRQPLSGQTAVVTGSSSGIGRAIALELAAAGADLVIHAHRNCAGAEEAAMEVRKTGGQSVVVLADLSDTRETDRLADEAWGWRGSIDIWVNNAGVDTLTGDGAKQSFEEKLHRLWQVDVLASVRLSRNIGRRMRERGRGVILNIGWDQAATGMEGDSGELFATSKGAVMAFTRSLAKSLAPHVRVNCIAPGWIKTAWGEQASQAWHDRAKRESLLGRWGTPEDIARVARFLASGDADFVTGQTIAVNGGHVSQAPA